jgi:Na+-transporting methylmalonyl-CoA/oxaloacetate decarboxylase gamma subunit
VGFILQAELGLTFVVLVLMLLTSVITKLSFKEEQFEKLREQKFFKL